MKYLTVSLLLASSLSAGEWTEKTLAGMSLDEKIGQLIIVPVCPLRTDERHQKDIEEALERWHVGGAIVKQGTLEQQFESIQEIQAQSKVHLLIVADAEWGLSMRASDAIVFPRNMSLGALQDSSLIEKMGRLVGEQLRSLGVHLNLAPVVDVNSNPLNPIIRMRSFGDNAKEVVDRSCRFVRGLQSAGILGCAKHFPGHGDTAVDSHHALPFIERSLQELEKVELLPFQAMIEEGVAAIMSAHIVVAAIDTLPTSLSSLCMTQLLQEKMGFRGLLITDALNMEALAQNYSVEEAALLAFKAGHHLLLYGDHINPRIDDILERQVPAAHAALKKAVISGDISEEVLNNRVRTILETKEKLKTRLSPARFSPEILQNIEAKQLANHLYRSILTRVKEKASLLPLSEAVYVDDENREFANRLQNRGIALAKSADIVVVALPDLRSSDAQEMAKAKLQAYASQGKEIIAFVFGSPYSLPYVTPYASTAILAYEDREETWEAAADLCTGRLTPQGKLPVTLNAE